MKKYERKGGGRKGKEGKKEERKVKEEEKEKNKERKGQEKKNKRNEGIKDKKRRKLRNERSNERGRWRIFTWIHDPNYCQVWMG